MSPQILFLRNMKIIVKIVKLHIQGSYVSNSIIWGKNKRTIKKKSIALKYHFKRSPTQNKTKQGRTLHSKLTT